MRANKNASPNTHAMVYTRVVLKLTVVADGNVEVDKDAFADDTALPNRRTRADLGLMPYARIIADCYLVFDLGGLVYTSR